MYKLIALFLFYMLLIAIRAEAHDLLCEHWMSGKYVGSKDAFETNPQVSDISRETSEDEAGVKAQCRDFFPTWGERMKLERTSADPFEVKYKIEREYCWARFWPLDSPNPRCGGPRISKWCLFIPCGFSWDPPSYTSWGDTKTKIVGVFNNGEEFEIFGGFNRVLLYRIQPQSAFPDGSKNISKRTKICAYFKTNFIGSLFTDNNSMIACVDEPFKPIPPTFNLIMPPNPEPYIDQRISKTDLIAHGSKFDQPLAILSFDDPQTSVTSKLFLRYKFPNDTSQYSSTNTENANAPICDKFPNFPLTYCAKVSETDPSEVCICEENSCDDNIFIGCAPRPAPKESNIAIIGSYQTDYNFADEPQPAINLILTYIDGNGNPLIIDKDGNEIYTKPDGKNYKKDANGNKTDIPAVDPLQYKKLPLPTTPISIKEYTKELMQDATSGDKSYLVTRGSGSAYGIKFNAIIPELDSSKKPKKIGVSTPQMRMHIDGCIVTTTERIEDYPSYYIPTGNRFRELCCPDSIIDINEQLNSCVVPKYNTSCLGSANSTPPWINKGENAPPQDKAAENAVCPGAYEGPLANPDGSLVNANILDRICITNESNWNEAMPEPYCVEMPRPCEEVKIPTEMSGYAIWKEIDPTVSNEQDGECKIEFGFDYNREIDIKLNDDILALQDDDPDKVNAWAKFNTAKEELTKLQIKAKKENRNIQLAEFSIATNIAISHGNDAVSEHGITISRKSPAAPHRKCIANIYGTEVKNPCVKADGCINITMQSPSSGNIILPAAIDDYKVSADLNASTPNSSSVNNPLTHEILKSGQCIAPYSATVDGSGSASIPMRQCLTDYYTNSNKVYVLRQVWSDNIENRCEKK